MLKRTTAVMIAVLIAFVASPVAAQECSLGVYGDANGTSGFISPVVGEQFTAYVVLFTENVVNGVGYTLVANTGPDLLFAGASYGPDGGGINIANDPSNELTSGANVGLGECAVGFNGFPVLVASYSFVPIGLDGAATFDLTGNAESSNLDPQFPVYADCNGVVRSCGIGPSLTVEAPVSTSAGSFGSVKSLYRN